MVSRAALTWPGPFPCCCLCGLQTLAKGRDIPDGGVGGHMHERWEAAKSCLATQQFSEAHCWLCSHEGEISEGKKQQKNCLLTTPDPDWVRFTRPMRSIPLSYQRVRGGKCTQAGQECSRWPQASHIQKQPQGAALRAFLLWVALPPSEGTFHQLRKPKGLVFFPLVQGHLLLTQF